MSITIVVEIIVTVVVIVVFGMLIWKGLTNPRPGGPAMPVRDVDAKVKARAIEMRLLNLEQEVLSAQPSEPDQGTPGEKGRAGRGGEGGEGGAGGGGGEGGLGAAS